MNEDKVIEKKTVKRMKKQNPQKAEPASGKNGFNFLDVLIIVCILAVVVLIVFVYSTPGELFNVNSNDTSIIYSINVSGVPAEYAAMINVGDSVTDSKGYSLGVVASDVEVQPHILYQYKENEDGSGSIVGITHPELVDLVITISAKAKVSDDGYTVDGMRIALESEYELVLPGFESKGICVSLSDENVNDAGASK